MPNSGIILPGSKNLAINPLAHKLGDMIRCINTTNDQFGAKKKRPGYTTSLGTIDGGAVLDLHNFTLDNGTQFWNYRNNNGTLYYSQQGTGAWTLCGNGTFTAGSHIGVGTLENTLIVGDGVAATRHTTNGTSFTNTTAAPIASRFVDFQQRIYAMGTSSTLFWSTTGTPTSWTGSDSSSVQIPGGGKLLDVMKVANNVVTTKNSGIIHRWDGYNLYDLSTNLGFTSPYSVANVEDYRFGLNRLGQFGFGGNKPEIISNPIEKLIYNDAGEGIIGTTFDNAQGVAHKYEYMVSIGTLNDNGSPIECIMEGIIHGNTLQEKKWNYFRAMFNPGMSGQVKIAISNTFTKGAKNWIDLGQAVDGIVDYHFPSGSRGRLLYWKITESSRNSRLHLYALEFSAELIEH